MPTLTASKTTYSFSIPEIKSMICRELQVPEAAVTVTYKQTDVSNDRYDRYPNYQVSGIEVTVDNSKLK